VQENLQHQIDINKRDFFIQRNVQRTRQRPSMKVP